jgi:hypothetical protein
VEVYRMNNSLLEALASYLAADPIISAIFAGIYTSSAAPGTALPYLTLLKASSVPVGILGVYQGKRAWTDKVTVNFEVRNTGADTADVLTEQLRTALMRRQQPLGWAAGQECGRWLAGDETGELEDGLGVNGTDVWVARLPVGFTITRTA